MKNILIFLLSILCLNSAITQSTEIKIIEKYIDPCVLEAVFENSIDLLRTGCAATTNVNISVQGKAERITAYSIMSNHSSISLREDSGNLFMIFILFRDEKDFSEFSNAWIKEFKLKTEDNIFYMHNSWPMFTLNLKPFIKDAPPNMIELWFRLP
jgi:hypothetical protein